jgi:hypothetical protein
MVDRGWPSAGRAAATPSLRSYRTLTVVRPSFNQTLPPIWFDSSEEARGDCPRPVADFVGWSGLRICRGLPSTWLYDIVLPSSV